MPIHAEYRSAAQALFAAAMQNDDASVRCQLEAADGVDRLRLIALTKDLSSRNFLAAGRALAGMFTDLDGWTHTPADEIVVSNGAPSKDTVDAVRRTGASFTLLGCSASSSCFRDVDRLKKLMPNSTIVTVSSPQDRLLLALEMIRLKDMNSVDVLVGPHEGPPWLPFHGPASVLDIQGFAGQDRTVAVSWTGPAPSDMLFALKRWADAGRAALIQVIDLHDSWITNPQREALQTVLNSDDTNEKRAVMARVNREFFEYAHLEDKGTAYQGSPSHLIDRASALVDIALGDLLAAGETLTAIAEPSAATTSAASLCFQMMERE